ncbi:MAG: tetratricopeptide repeat protein [Burkholderiaceae bacterium]
MHTVKPSLQALVPRTLSATRFALAAPLSGVCLAVCLLASGAVYADDYADVNRLLRAGQVAEASAKVDQFLATKPKDAQMRFLKGVIFTEQSKPNDAISTFTKLTEDFPELPEPYNNLAVLYAGQSQFDKARAALEMAIRTNPSYATAHENLGDVYAKLASQAYSKALQLDNSNTGVQPKLSLIRDLFAPGAKGQRPTAAAVAPPVLPPPVVVAAAPPPAPPVVPPAPVVKPPPTPPVAVPAPPPVAAVKPPAPVAPPPVAAVKPPAPAAVGSGNADQDIGAAVRNWAAAWSAKDLSGYYAAYGSDFDAPGGRKTWEEERKKRILGKSRISVKVGDMAIKVNGDKAQVRFKQEYDADALSVSSRKTLDLAKSGGRWVIVKESTGG